jgi:hypothetical protein
MRRARTGTVTAAAFLGAAFAGCGTGDPAPTSKPPVAAEATGPLWAVGGQGESWPFTGISLVERYDPPAR